MRRDLGIILASFAVGMSITNFVYTIASTYVHTFPNTEHVQQGFVIPSKLEIEIKDIDNNNQNEVIMEYDGKKYLLKLNEQKRPVIQDYQIKK